MAGITQILSQSENFPKVPGDQPWSVVDIAGPASYVQLVPAAPIVTGGQQIDKTVLGLATNVVFAAVLGSDDGTYYANVFLKPFIPGQPTGSGAVAGGIVLQWITAATGAEVSAGVVLSARTLRVLAIGRN